MMDMLVKDLDKEMTVTTAMEKDAQADYETLMKESAAKRAEDSKSLEDKEAAIAEMQGFLESEKEAKAADERSLQEPWRSSPPSTPNAIGCSSILTCGRTPVQARSTHSVGPKPCSAARTTRFCRLPRSTAC